MSAWAAAPPLNWTWPRLGTALVGCGVVTSSLAEVSSVVGLLAGGAGTIVVGALAGRRCVLWLAPLCYLGSAIVVLAGVHVVDFGTSLLFVLTLAAPLMFAYAASLLAIGVAVRDVRRRRGTRGVSR